MCAPCFSRGTVTLPLGANQETCRLFASRIITRFGFNPPHTHTKTFDPSADLPLSRSHAETLDCQHLVPIHSVTLFHGLFHGFLRRLMFSSLTLFSRFLTQVVDLASSSVVETLEGAHEGALWGLAMHPSGKP